eukprot:CAMPEP_0195321476 /NCGR_PEP_ID=MMETSP0708-20121125/6738_1 /TAXON_ID=33640 /ORGANISM="Asterionellopsis glacialis, Strain CCMP134" /LENGTH=598 /DNA_ID=CAMNT_0040388117 /DNA_START=121 /DNA_END=1918 /DNA_ORIENTATION=+
MARHPVKKDANNPPGKIRDQLRYLLYVKIYDAMCSARKGNQKLSLKQQQTFCFDHYHGNEKKDIVSVVDEFLRRENEFSSCFVPHRVHTGEFVLSNKFYIYPEADDKVQLNKNITAVCLKRTSFKTNSAIVQGRTILTAALRALRALRKVIPIAEKLWDFKTGLHKLGSGGNHEKAIELLLDRCYAAGIGVLDMDEDDEDMPVDQKVVVKVEKTDTKEDSVNEDVEEEKTGDTNNISTNHEDNKNADNGNNDNDDDDDNDNDDDSAECEIVRPNGYFFPGFMAFLLFGPIGDNVSENRVMDFFRYKEDPPAHKKKEYSRASSKALQKEQAAKERKNEDSNCNTTHNNNTLSDLSNRSILLSMIFISSPSILFPIVMLVVVTPGIPVEMTVALNLKPTAVFVPWQIEYCCCVLCCSLNLHSSVPPAHKKKEYSRASSKALQKEQAAKERKNEDSNCNTTHNNNTLSAKEQIQLSALDLKQQSFQQGCRESQLLTLQLEQRMLGDEIKIIERRIERFERSDRDTSALENEIDEKLNEIKKLHEAMADVRMQTETATVAGTKRTLETINILGDNQTDDVITKKPPVEIHSTTVSVAGSDIT